MTRLSRTTVSDILVLSLLSLLGIAGYETSFGDLNFLVAAIAGLVVGTLAAVAGTVWRLGAVTTVLLAMAGYVLVGTPVTMPDAALFAVLPSLEGLTGLVIGPVYGWADIVTIGTPVEAPDYVAVVPYFAAWLVALVGTMLATRWLPRRRTALRSSVLLIGPVVLYLSGILLGTDEAYFAGVRGVAFAVIALVWLAWRRGATVEASGEGAARLRRQKVAGTATVVAGAMAIGAVAGLALAPVSPDRFVLRDEVVPPFDPLEFPSPLSGFRTYTKDLAETPLFEVTGLEPGDVIRLATMDAYTGRLWNVAGPDDVGPDGGGYGIVGETLPEPLLATLGSERRVEVQVDAYDDVWLPTVGYGEALSLVDPGTSDRAGDLRYNPSAGTAVLTSGVAEGAGYELDARVQVEPETDELLDTPVANLAMPAVENAPDVVAAKADEYVGEATTPIEQLRAIETGLKTNGFLSHGLASDTVPSRAGHGADRIIELFTRTQMVGDEEQYASAMALMARHLGYPARVVMGFAPEVGDDAQAGRGGRRRRHRVGRGAVRGRRLGVVPPHARPGRRAAGADAEAEVRAAAAGPPAAARRARRGAAAHHRRDRRLRRRPRPAVRPARLGVGHRRGGRHPRGARVPADARGRGREGRTASPSPQRRERPPGCGSLGGARRPLRRARVRAAGAGHAAAVRPRARTPARRAGPRRHAAGGFAAGAASPSPIAASPAPVRLSTLAATIDRDVFAGGEVSDAMVEDRWTTADAATAAVARAAGRVRRLISRYRVRSRR